MSASPTVPLIFPVDAGLLRPRALRQILSDSVALYRQRGWAMTRVLILPVLAQIVGLGLAILLPYSLLGWLRDPLLTLWQELALVALVFLSALPGLMLFCGGVWEYLLYWVSLNTNTLEALAGQPLQLEAARRRVPALPYANVLLAMALLWLIPVGAALLAPLLTLAGSDPLARLAILGGGCLFSGLLFLAAMVVSLYLCLVFQVLAFEPATANPLPVLQRSICLVQGHLLRTLALVLACGGLTTVLLPTLLQLLCDGMQLTGLVAWAVLPLVHEVLDKTRPGADTALGPQYALVHGMLVNMAPKLAFELARALMLFAFTSLLLPYGTFCFTLLYLDLASRERLPALPSAVAEPVGSDVS